MSKNYENVYAISDKTFNSILTKIYNLEQKMQFIEDYCGHQKANSRLNIIRFFKSTGEFEKKYKKDINKFNIFEITDWLKSLKLNRKDSFDCKKTTLKKYIVWSISKELIDNDSIDIIKEISIKTVLVSNIYDNNMVSSYFKDFDDLNKGINTVIDYHNYEDIKAYDILKACFYLAWCGLEIDEICNIKKDDIDYINSEININNKVYKINTEISKFLMSYVNSSGYNTITGINYNYFNNEYVIRRVQQKKSIAEIYNPSLLRSKISTFIEDYKDDSDVNKNDKYYNHSFNYDNIKDSGLYYNIYQYEKENNIKFSGGDLDKLEDFIGRYYIEKSNISNLFQDYSKWKRCFYHE